MNLTGAQSAPYARIGSCFSIRFASPNNSMAASTTTSGAELEAGVSALALMEEDHKPAGSSGVEGSPPLPSVHSQEGGEAASKPYLDVMTVSSTTYTAKPASAGTGMSRRCVGFPTKQANKQTRVKTASKNSKLIQQAKNKPIPSTKAIQIQSLDRVSSCREFGFGSMV